MLTKQNGDTQPKQAAAQWVKQARTNLDLTQTAFAEKIGVHWVTVSNWERGKYAPDWHSTEKIRRLDPTLPAAPGVLPPQIAVQVDSRPRTLEAAEVAALIDSMPQELRAYVRDTVYRIVSSRSSTPPPPAPGKKSPKR